MKGKSVLAKKEMTPGQVIQENELLMSNEKINVKDLWNAPPNPEFPDVLLGKLKLDEFLEESN